MADAHKNFAVSTVATAPSPATSGTSLVVASGDGAKFPAAPFNATVWPASSQPTTANAEIVRVTAVSTDTLTITRIQEGTTARSIGTGDQIAATITAKTLTDVEAVTESQVTSPVAFRDSSTFSSSSTSSASVTVPAAARVGDLLLLCVTTMNVWTASTPTGWTQLRVDTSTASSNVPARQYIFWKIAAASDLGTSAAVPFSGGARVAISMLAYSGVNQTTPVDVSGASVSSVDGSTITAPSVTTTTPNGRVVEIYGAVATTAVTDNVTGNPATTRTAIAGSSNYIGQATSDQATAAAPGATGATTATPASTSSWTGTTVALAAGNAAVDIAGKLPVPENPNVVAASSTAQTIPDVTAATVNYITLTGNCTFTFPTAAAGKRFQVALKQDATGSRTVTWPGTVKWSGGTTPTLTTAAGKTDVFEFICFDGTNWVGQTIGLNY